MKKPGLLTCAALGALLAGAPARAAFKQRDSGTTAAQFLKLGADARAAGMGDAIRADAEDATAVYWNPAGLAGLVKPHANFTHGAHFQGIFYDFAAYAHPIGSILGQDTQRRRRLRETQLGTIGVAVLYTNSGSLAEVDNTGMATGDNFTPQDLAGMAGWGGSLARNLDVGITLKYIYSKLHTSAQSFGGDAGARLRLRVGRMPLTLSVGAHNFGGTLRYVGETQDLPFYVSGAASLGLFKGFTVTGDLIAPRDNRIYPNMGAEYRHTVSPVAAFALRAGYNGTNDDEDLKGISTIRVGGGVSIRQFDVDYAWTPFGELKSSHRFSLSYRFSESFMTPRPAARRDAKPTVEPRRSPEPLRREKEPRLTIP